MSEKNIKDILGHGSIDFLGVNLQLAAGTLVPRKETELLGQTVSALLKDIQKSDSSPKVIDMCCGVGNLACYLGVTHPEASIVASDLTDECVTTAQANVSNLELNDRVEVVQGDLFEKIKAKDDFIGKTNLIVCNPPYISEAKLATDKSYLLEDEPKEAFAAGPYGISIHQQVCNQAGEFLCEGGHLAFEIGKGQEKQVRILFKRARIFDNITFIENQDGEVRVIYARKITK